jgi:hypothetical protein
MTATPSRVSDADDRRHPLRRVLLGAELLMWVVAGTACFLALAVFAPSDEHCSETNGQIVSSHAFVVSGWVCGLACLAATCIGVVRHRGTGVRILVGVAYLLVTVVVVVVVALHDNPCGFS